MVKFKKGAIFSTLCLLVTGLFIAMSEASLWAASGNIVINSPSAQPYYTTGDFSISGTYTLTSDDSPNVPGTSAPYLQLMDLYGTALYAELLYSGDGVTANTIPVQYSGVGPYPFGTQESLSIPVHVGSLGLGTYTVTINFHDVYGQYCTVAPCGGYYAIRKEGSDFGQRTFVFEKVTEGQRKSCYDGPSGTAGVGICRYGTRTYSNGQWGPCIGQVLPQTEICDGLDNDCNSQTDEVCACIHNTTLPCYDGTAGTQGVGTCRTGQKTCLYGVWSSCVGQVMPQPEICDGQDHNCNGDPYDVPGDPCCGNPDCGNKCIYKGGTGDGDSSTGAH